MSSSTNRGTVHAFPFLESQGQRGFGRRAVLTKHAQEEGGGRVAAEVVGRLSAGVRGGGSQEEAVVGTPTRPHLATPGEPGGQEEPDRLRGRARLPCAAGGGGRTGAPRARGSPWEFPLPRGAGHQVTRALPSPQHSSWCRASPSVTSPTARSRCASWTGTSTTARSWCASTASWASTGRRPRWGGRRPSAGTAGPTPCSGRAPPGTISAPATTSSLQAARCRGEVSRDGGERWVQGRGV